MCNQHYIYYFSVGSNFISYYCDLPFARYSKCITHSYCVLYVSLCVLFSLIDDIALQYIVSILEELGGSNSFEDIFDVDEFTEMMEAYVPGFQNFNRLDKIQQRTEKINCYIISDQFFSVFVQISKFIFRLLCCYTHLVYTRNLC